MKISGNEYISIQVPLEISDAKEIKKVNLKIEASHAGVVNGNYMFYTPRALKSGSESLKEFYKPLQKQHYSKTLGYIVDSYYHENNIKSDYLTRINNSKTPEELVKATNDYIRSDEYAKNKKGFGYLVAKAKLYNPKKIEELVTKNSRGTVSIAGDSDLAYCSICAKDLTKCSHKLGTRYNGLTCLAIVNSLELDHISFETIPADWESNTVIVQDSQPTGKLEITDYNAQEGTLMKLTLTEFKEKLLSTDLILDELDLASFSESYKTEITQASNSQFALPAEKLLPTNTKLTTFVSKLLLDLLEDSSDKEFIAKPINESYTKFFGEKTTEEAKESLSVEEIPVKTSEVEIEPVEEVQIAAPATPVEPIENTLQVADADKIVLAIQDALNTKLDEAIAKLSEIVLKEQEVKGNQILQAQIDAFKSDLQSAKVFEDQLTNELRLSILNQIKTLKGISEEDPYFVKLSKRSIQELKMTLEDHIQLFNTSVVETKEVVQVQDAVTVEKTDAGTASTVMSDDTDDSLPITDADKVVEKIIKEIPSEKISDKEFVALYKKTVISHGSAVAKKLHNVLTQNNRI